MTNLPTPNIDYLERFDYAITVKLGKSYSKEFKTFYEWCNSHLGVKYKDWFIVSSGKDTYTLKCRNNKWAMFLALTWIDVIE